MTNYSVSRVKEIDREAIKKLLDLVNKTDSIDFLPIGATCINGKKN